MPRDLSVPIDAGIDAHITEPVYLVSVELAPSSLLYWTTSAQLTWNTIVWQPVGMRILSLSESGARLELRNDDNTGSALILNSTLRDKEFRIYLYYNGDAHELYRFYGSAARVGSFGVQIDLAVDRSRNTLAPRGRIAAPKFTNLPRLGEVIQWGSQHYKVTY